MRSARLFPAPMAKIAITGVTGLVGGHVGRALHHAGHQVVGISRQAGGTWHAGRAVAVPDLADANALASALSGCDIVFHFADRADRRSYVEQDVGTAALMARAIRRAANETGITRIVLASSIYAERDDLYGCSKRQMEEAGMAPEPGARGLILRLPPLYGPGAKGAVRHIARAVEKGWPLPFALANAPRRFLSLDALADLCRHLVEMDAQVFQQATGRIWLPVDVRSGSLRALTRSLEAPGQRARLLPVPLIDRLLGASVPPGQLEADRDALLAATGWQATS